MNLQSDNKNIYGGSFGLERETLRVMQDGSLSNTPHPFEDNKFLDRDFCENQLELITPVCDDIPSLMQSLSSLDKEAKSVTARNGEYLWLSSNPPHFTTEDDIPIAHFTAEKSFKQDYRMNLQRRYGKRIMLYSGIHFNFSFSDNALRAICGENYTDSDKNNLYFRLSKQSFRYSWLLVLLTAASPVYDKSLDGDYLHGDGFDGYATRRNSEKGYWNQFIPVLDYSSIDTYIEGIRSYIQKGALFSAGELYLPIRLKPEGGNTLEALENGGVNHIELRMFDLNTLSPLGIFREDLEFAHYFLIYLASLPDFDFTPEMQASAVKNHREAAKFDISDIKIGEYSAKDASIGMLDDMSAFFEKNPNALANIKLQKDKITQNKRYCVEIYDKLHENFHDKMIKLAREGYKHV